MRGISNKEKKEKDKMISLHKNKDKREVNKKPNLKEPRQFLVIIITPEIFLKLACTG
jgi:hypothetical protein